MLIFIMSVVLFKGLIIYEKKCSMQAADQYWKACRMQAADQYWKAKRNQNLAEENQKKAYSDNLNDSSPVYINDAVDTYFLADYLAGDSAGNSGCDSAGDSGCDSAGDSGCDSAGDSGCDSAGDSTGGSTGGFGDFGGW